MSSSSPPNPALTELRFASETRAELENGNLDPIPLTAFLYEAVHRHAQSLTDGQTLELVTMSVDVTGEKQDAGLSFDCALDRKTRTLVFVGGRALYDTSPRLKMSAIFRIVAEV